MATLAQIAKIMAGLAPAYANSPELSEENYRVYHHLLSDLPDELLDLAATSLGSKTRFFPSAGELRQEAIRLLEKTSGVRPPYQALMELEHSFATHGLARGEPEWSHPLIGQAIRAIGTYADLCRSTNHVSDRAQFLKAYEELREEYREEQYMLPDLRARLPRLGSGESPEQVDLCQKDAPQP